MDYSLYENIITKKLIYYSTLSVIAMIFSIVCLIYLVKKMRDEKALFCFLMILLCFSIVGSVVLGGKTIYSSIYDIKNQAYICYEGEFLIDTDVETRNGTCTTRLGDGTKLETDAYQYLAGTYTGKVIYGEKTKIVLDIQPDE